MNINLTYSVVTTEAISVIVCLILLYGNIYETHRKTEYGNMFSWLLFTNIWALVFDGLSWVLEGNEELLLLLHLCNTLSIVLSFVLIAEYSLYLATYIGTRRIIPKRIIRSVLIFYSVAIAVTLVACFSGHMYKLVDGVFVPEFFYTIYSVVAAIALFTLFGIIIGFRKVLGTHDFIATCSYVFLPIICAVINLFFSNYTFIYQASTLSMLVLYVMIQSEQGNKLAEESKISNYFANHDALTGLNSRRAYIAKIYDLSKSEHNAGVLFCDLNGLKYTNDNFGHQKGDETIIAFAELLKKHFSEELLFRISGDEFVVLADSMEKDEFMRLMKTLKLYAEVDGMQTASIGECYGSASDIDTLIRKAEAEMYIQKEQFYSSHKEMYGRSR